VGGLVSGRVCPSGGLDWFAYLSPTAPSRTSQADAPAAGSNTHSPAGAARCGSATTWPIAPGPWTTTPETPGNTTRMRTLEVIFQRSSSHCDKVTIAGIRGAREIDQRPARGAARRHGGVDRHRALLVVHGQHLPAVSGIGGADFQAGEVQSPGRRQQDFIGLAGAGANGPELSGKAERNCNSFRRRATAPRAGSCCTASGSAPEGCGRG